MSSSRYNYNMHINSDVVKDIMDIAEKIENEKKSNEPNTEQIKKLYYQQLIRGMELGTTSGRNYGINKPF